MTPERQEPGPVPAAEPCPSHSKREGLACTGQKGHGGLHHCRSERALVVWSDEASPEHSLDLLRR